MVGRALINVIELDFGRLRSSIYEITYNALRFEILDDDCIHEQA